MSSTSEVPEPLLYNHTRIITNGALFELCIEEVVKSAYARHQRIESIEYLCPFCLTLLII